MCNPYSHTTTQDALRALRRGFRDIIGNLDRQPAILPDGLAPMIRNAADGASELLRMRSGFPPVAGPLVTKPQRQLVLLAGMVEADLSVPRAGQLVL